MLLAVRREVIEQLFADPKWVKTVEKAKTAVQVEKVIMAYAKEKKLKVKTLQREG